MINTKFFKRLYLFIFLFLFKLFSSQFFIIGDSQSFYLEKNSSAKIYPKLAERGIGLKNLIEKLNKIESDYSVKAIFISIGVNDSYIDYGIKNLINITNTKFPNAFIFVIKGSYEWGNAKISRKLVLNYINYYEKFRKEHVYVLQQDIGPGDPHIGTKKEYVWLGKSIDKIINKIK